MMEELINAPLDEDVDDEEGEIHSENEPQI